MFKFLRNIMSGGKGAMKLSEAKYEDLYDNAPDMFASVDAKTTKIIECNNTLLKALGYSKEELIGRPIFDVYPPDTIEYVKENVFRPFVETGVVRDVELQLMRRDGSRIDVLLNVSSVRDERGEVLYSRSIWRDITARKRAESELRFHDRILTDMAEGVFLTRVRDSVIVYANPKFNAMFGYGEGELTGRDISVINASTEKDPREVAEEIIGSLKEKGVWSGEVNNIRKDSTTFWCFANVSTFEHHEYGTVWISVHTDITTRKRAEEELKQHRERLEELVEERTAELKQSHSLLKAVIEGSTDPIFVKDIEGRYLMINSAGAGVIGRPKEEIIGSDDAGVFPVEIARGLMDADRRIMESGEARTFEETVTQDGETRTFSSMKAPWRDARGEVTGLIGIVRDITDRRRAEQNLRKERDSAQNYLDLVGAMIVAIDVSQNIIRVNKSCCEILGYSEQELLNKNWFDLVVPESIRENVKAHFASIMAGGLEPLEYYENPVVTKAGDERIISWHNMILRNDEGNIVASLSSGEDITDLQRAEKEIVKVKQDWEETFDTLTDMVTIHDADFNIILANRAAKKILHLPFMTTTKEKCFRHYHGTDGPPEGCPSCKCLETGKPAQFELFEPHLDMFIEIRAIPRKGDDGRVVGLIHIVRDITKRRQAEELLRETEAKLLKAQKMEVMGNMAAGMAHEVRNPLNSLMALTDALVLEIGDKPETRPYIKHIKDQVDRLAVLMTDLLDLGKPMETSGLEQADLYKACHDAAVLCSKAFEGEPNKYRIIKGQRKDPMKVTADTERLTQVFRNLLENAFRHTPGEEETQIIIDAPPYIDGKCKVKVVDRGTGVPEEYFDKIFEPFFSTRRGGTGLGLSIVKNVVESYGGNVRLYNNEPGPGCTVEVTLPLVGQKQS